MWNELSREWWSLSDRFRLEPTFSSAALKYCVLIVYVCNMNSIDVGLGDPRLDALLGVASELQVRSMLQRTNEEQRSVDQRTPYATRPTPLLPSTLHTPPPSTHHHPPHTTTLLPPTTLLTAPQPLGLPRAGQRGLHQLTV